jgi:plasmid stabilization system protein ParE
MLQSEAILDIQEAFEWYEKQRLDLGYEFIEEIETGFERIVNHPLYYTSINEQYRRIKVNRFPYLIVYEIEGSNIIVNSVRHTSRKPKY